MRSRCLFRSFLCLLILAKCSPREKRVVEGEFVRITSSIDSAKEMAVVYRSMIDSNKVLTRSYWNNGDLQASGSIYKRMKHGRWKFYNKGIVVYTGLYLNNQKDGVHIHFTDKGDTLRIEYYKMGEKIGRWMYFDSLGMPFKAEEYSDTLIEN